MIEVKNLRRGYFIANGQPAAITEKMLSGETAMKVKTVLFDLNLTIEPGHVYGLIGRNGAGKTTLLNNMAGMYIFMQKFESIYIDGILMNSCNPNILAKLFYVTDTIAGIHILADSFAGTLSRLYPNFSMESYKEYMEMFQMDRNVFLDELSLGEAKMVFLCYAFATGVPYLILDEPTNGLDITARKVFRKLIASNMTDDKAIIISTHHINEISSLIDHILILDKKHIVFDHSVMETGKRLSFIESDDESKAQNALYSAASAYGKRLITPNIGEFDSEVDFELLFEAVLENGEKINELFTDK